MEHHPDAANASAPLIGATPFLPMTAKKSFLLRIDPALWAEVERLAQADLRSANAEVEFLLREGLNRRGLRARVEAARIADDERPSGD